MDVVVYFGLNAFAGVGLLFLVNWKRRMVGIFPFLFAFIALYTFFGVTTDGNLTAISGANQTQIVTDGQTAEWNAIIFVPFFIAAADWMGALLRSGKII